MSMAHAFPVTQAPPSGGCEFLTRAQRSERCRRLAEQGWVVARVVPVFDHGEDETPTSGMRQPLRRGGLCEALEGAVELSLALRGAVPPEVSTTATPLAMARDQLFRVRALGATGLCLVMPELRGMCENAVLVADDSMTLSVWRMLCETESVWLLFDERDHDVAMLA
ncbi:MAG TPA: hypothetical protein VFB62_05355, partial [Polyangiaceae bacterium]|nr:hypothetical protein [Polyangiaceae bacterium]